MVINRFDKVTLITTANIKYLSDKPGEKTTPDGIWSVIGAIDNELLVSKQEAIVKVPYQDVLLRMKYQLPNIEKMTNERRKDLQENKTQAKDNTGSESPNRE